MKIAHWYYKHFNNEKLIEELSKPVEGEYVVLKEGNMLTRVKKEELAEYINHLKEVGNYYLDRYEQCKKGRTAQSSKAGSEHTRGYWKYSNKIVKAKGTQFQIRCDGAS